MPSSVRCQNQPPTNLGFHAGDLPRRPDPTRPPPATASAARRPAGRALSSQRGVQQRPSHRGRAAFASPSASWRSGHPVRRGRRSLGGGGAGLAGARPSPSAVRSPRPARGRGRAGSGKGAGLGRRGPAPATGTGLEPAAAAAPPRLTSGTRAAERPRPPGRDGGQYALRIGYWRCGPCARARGRRLVLAAGGERRESGDGGSRTARRQPAGPKT